MDEEQKQINKEVERIQREEREIEIDLGYYVCPSIDTIPDTDFTEFVQDKQSIEEVERELLAEEKYEDTFNQIINSHYYL